MFGRAANQRVTGDRESGDTEQGLRGQREKESRCDVQSWGWLRVGRGMAEGTLS